MPTGETIRGELSRTENGSLVLKMQGGELPVRLLGTDLPLQQELVFQVIGREDASLLLSVVKPADHPLAGMLKSFGLDPAVSWHELIQGLIRENMPISRENLIQMERFLRIARQEWGVVLYPRVIAHLMSSGLSVTPDTVLAAIYRLFPEFRKDFPGERRTLPVNPEDVKGLEQLFHGRFQALQGKEDTQNLSMFMNPTVWQTKDGGEIHWPAGQGESGSEDSKARFALELIPPNLGLVEINGIWEEHCCYLTFTVESGVAELFKAEISKWRTHLAAAGILAQVSVKAVAEETGLPAFIDGWV